MHNVDIRNISVGQILYFIKVAEYQNISKAAQYFNLSQSTLSKKLKSLEAQLDLQLFFRQTNTIALTPAGQYMYKAWTERMSGLEEEIQYAHVIQQGQNKSIVAACLDSFNPKSFLLPLVDRFLAAHPDVNLRIESDAAQDIREMLLHGEVDVIFSIFYDFLEKDGDQIEWRMLGKTSNCACVSKSNPLAGRKRISMEDLKQAEFICISPQYLPEYAQMIHDLCKRHGFAPNITKYVTSANSLTLNIRGEKDVFICDRYYADLNKREHVLIPIEDTESGFIMAWKKDKEKACLQQFIDTVLDSYC